MNIRAALGLLVLGAVPWLAAGDEPVAAADPAPAVQDLVYYGSRQPVYLRLHLYVNGKPFRLAWDEALQALFTSLDRDGNGSLDAQEAAGVPRAPTLRELLRGMPPTAAAGRVTLTQLDNRPRDGKVSREEFRRYFRRFGVTALQVTLTRVHGDEDNPLTGALCRRLDSNEDGKLSPEEVGRAAAALHRLDLNDDEMISARELAPGLRRPAFRRPQRADEGMENTFAYLPDEADYALVAPGETLTRVAEQLVARYKDRDGKVPAAATGLPRDLVTRLDADRDGRLDAPELGQLAALPPLIELTLRFEEPGPPTGLESVVNPLGALLRRGLAPRAGMPLSVQTPAGAPLGADAVRMLDREGVLLRLEDALLELRRSDGLQAGASLRQALRQQFSEAGGDDETPVEQGEVQGPQRLGLQAVFALADRNADGKLTRAELDAALSQLDQGSARALLLTITDHGRGLFELLDENGDGHLGLRELRRAWARMAPWDRDGDGQLAADEVPRRVQCVLSRGPAPTLPDPRSATALQRPTPRGPAWFQRMDRNGDGDVSAREFLGRPEDFQRLDADADGLIDAAEAERTTPRVP